MNELQIFENPEFGKLRTVSIEGEPWFVGKDAAGILGYTNPQKAVRDHVDDEDRTVNDSFTVNGTAVTLINESGVYSLVFGSKLPKAKKFKHWVTSEVLPSIRRTGSYSINVKGDMEQGEFLAKLASKTKDNRQRAILIARAANIGLGWEVLPIPSYDQEKMAKADIPYEDYGVADFLETADVLNRPTYEVHSEYVGWCRENHIEPTNKINFSKVVSRVGSYRVADKHWQQRKYRIFVKR